jgi:plastocyanin
MIGMQLLRASAVAVAIVAGAAGFGTPAPGKIVDVKMTGDAAGYRFTPAKITINRGDQVRFTLVSGPPHNVVFWADSIPAAAAAQLTKNMPNASGPLTGPFFMSAGDKYVVSFAGLPAGKYRYNCMPHLALGMTGTIEVK